MAGEVGCRLQTPVLLRRPVLKKIHSCHKHALSVYERRGGSKQERTLPAFLQLRVLGEAHSKSMGAKNPHASLASSRLPMGEMAPHPSPSSPVLKRNPFANWGFLILIWIRSFKGSVEGGEALDLHFRP